MPAKFFICPDGQQVDIGECINKGCRMAWRLPAGRCLSVRTLRAIADQREWKGMPSTTQLLKGVRESYLEITTDYAIDPQESLFRVHGSKCHAFLDQFVGGNELGEERLTDEVTTGQFDFYENETLWDNKFWGSYRINKALGLQQIEIPTGEVYKTGKNKGKPKIKKQWVEGAEPDLFNETIQLNDYRMKLERLGFPVTKIFLEAIGRDSGTYIAKNRGIEQKGILIPVPIIPDEEVTTYLQRKRDALLTALETNTIPPICDQRERWADSPEMMGRKCEKYCNVRETCLALMKGEVKVG